MKKLLFILLISFTSCVVPQHIDSKKCCDKHTYYNSHYQPTKIVVVKKNKPKYKKRHVKVKVNKHRKRK
tara:strand:- start:309 stop:515 length:207 start_codon:yes stop_codon:yes gene_type:complete